LRTAGNEITVNPIINTISIRLITTAHRWAAGNAAGAENNILKYVMP